MSRRIRKTRIVKERDPRSVHQLGALFLLCAAAAVLFLFSLWQRVELTGLHYQIEKLRSERDALLEIQKQLRVQRSALRSLPRVERIARQGLGLRPPAPGKIFAVDRSGRLIATAAAPEAVPRP